MILSLPSLLHLDKEKVNHTDDTPKFPIHFDNPGEEGRRLSATDISIAYNIRDLPLDIGRWVEPVDRGFQQRRMIQLPLGPKNINQFR